MRRTKFFVSFVCLVYKGLMHRLYKKADEWSRVVINFHEMKLTDGVAHMILPGANRDAETD
jgi:hypothetical protein